MKLVLALLASLLCTSRQLQSQELGRNIEVFGSVGGVAGVTPVRTEAGNHIDPHAGFRFDVGLQFERMALGFGARYVELLPTSEYGGRSLDGFVQGEVRVGDASTRLRATLGYGLVDIDAGHGPDVPTRTSDGTVWSAGIGREVIFWSGARAIISADVVVPPAGSDVRTVRRPLLEIGFGYRWREFHAIRPLGFVVRK